MEKKTIAIVGAGICGLYLAWKLSKQGHQVTVFEARKIIGKETCSGLFSERILEFIPQLKKDLIENEIEYALLHFPKRTIRINFSREFLVIDHASLDRFVASLVKKKKVKMVLGKRINSLPRGFDRIIGADGALSQVRKCLGLNDPQLRLGIQGFVFKKDSSPFVETWPTQSGFLWKIPRGEKTEYGILEKKERAKELFEGFLSEKNIKLKKMRSALIPQGLVVSFNPQVVLCGDAAGLTKPWSGGGVIWGLTAADILLKTFPDTLKYSKEVKDLFLPKIAFSMLATRLVYLLGFRFPFLIPNNIIIESDFLL